MTAKQRAIRERLRQLEDESGFLDLELVIDDARDPNSPMHDQFTWDVNQAAMERWKDQARAMIRSVRYTEQTTKVELDVSHYVSVSQKTERAGYMSLDSVRTQKDLSEDVFNEELKRARAALERARAVSDILGRRAELEQAIEWIANLQRAAA